nr:AAA family ATPase [Allomuricauda sp.]
MDIKDYIKKFALPFDKMKSEFEEDYDFLYGQEKKWLCNLEDKVNLLKNEKNQAEINTVIHKLKSDDLFTENDTKILSTFVSKVNTIVRVANRINNFKEGTKLDDDSKLELYKFFNEAKKSPNLKSFTIQLNSNLNNFLPHIFSVIKHCQNPVDFPIYYKYWKNIIREVLTRDNDYDSICEFYRSFPETNRHLNFATYLGIIGIQIAKNINSVGTNVTVGSKEYKYLTQDVINIERYSSILDENLNLIHQFFLVGAYWDGSNPSNQTDRFLNNGIWENGYDDKFIEEVKKVPEGSRIAIKAAFTREKTKSVMAIKARGIVSKNYDDGKKLKVNWENDFTPFEVDFSGGYWATIKEVTNEEHIRKIWFQNEISDSQLHAKVIYSYLKNSLSHRKIQSEILGEKAPARGGGFLAMEILHSYEIQGDKKGILKNTPFDIEYKSATGKYLEALELLKENYPEFDEETEKDNDMTFPLNIILYGPPGTGKTYNTVLRAAEIILNRKIDSYDEALEIFKANLHNQIEFITFHQNYSYEDFIQGLRPDTENDKELTFERKDGVFKVIADKALKNIMASEQPPIVKKTFEETFNEFFNPLVEGEVEEIEVKMKKVSYFITAITNKSIQFRKTSGGTEHTLSISTLRKMYDAESVLDIQGLSSYYTPLLGELLKIGKDSSGKKEIIQRKNYVIIIDEINRANISRVFGELITLIESDKRSHGRIPMEAKLPSGDTFIVPSNLYIIGTMNTADKSIALLDIALRRRFEFEAMYPKYSEDGLNVNDENVLKSINESIISDKGHDFQIGHSFFMDSQEDPYDFKRRMNVKVIPLLLEYFMNDSKAVTQIISRALSNTQFSIDDKSWPLRISKTNE